MLASHHQSLQPVTMNCPFCTNPDTKVTDSRPDQDGIRRWRECPACGQRFSTIERVELGAVAILKKDTGARSSIAARS